jgi:hypothetical protein
LAGGVESQEREMARVAGISAEQRRALDRLSAVRGVRRFHLAGESAIKLAAISKRGLKRDFWDLHAILESGYTLDAVCRAYVKRFSVAETDLYHVIMGLTWFEDAERETVPPIGMTPARWKKMRAFFEAAAPRIVLGESG